jgi:hypothetical protein
MTPKTLPIRALKYAAISSSIIILFVFYAMLTREVVGTPSEVVFRLVVSIVGVFVSMWLVFIVYLFLNPDADVPRNRE